MAVRVIQANGRQYLFSPDDALPLAARYWALVRARLLNDVTLEPVTGDIRLESDLEMTVPRIADDGVVGLVAVPKDIFPVLAGRNYTLHLTIHATGYLSQTIAAVIPTVQKTTASPLPNAGDGIITLNDTADLQIGELLMIGNPLTTLGSRFEEVRITALGPGVSQVTIEPALAMNHNAGPEPVVPVIPANFGPTDVGDVLMVPQP